LPPKEPVHVVASCLHRHRCDCLMPPDTLDRTAVAG
jgi:hypothetical protein